MLFLICLFCFFVFVFSLSGRCTMRVEPYPPMLVLSGGWKLSEWRECNTWLFFACPGQVDLLLSQAVTPGQSTHLYNARILIRFWSHACWFTVASCQYVNQPKIYDQLPASVIISGYSGQKTIDGWLQVMSSFVELEKKARAMCYDVMYREVKCGLESTVYTCITISDL